MLSGQNVKGRAQWTSEEAWKWHKIVGIIKGFNAPIEAHPGMTQDDILKKASSLGFNSVRIWMPSQADRCISELRSLLERAAKYNMTVSPVLGLPNFFRMPDQKEAEQELRNYLKKVLGEFRDEPRIVFWDLVNEPALSYFTIGEDKWTELALAQLEWCRKSILIAREEAPSQPITISAIYLIHHIYRENKVIDKFREIAAMTDIHNFHLYDLAFYRMKAIDDLVKLLKEIGDRPIVCTEAVARTRGGTFARSLTAFAKYHIHFYIWGMYVSDANWHVAWNLSSFEPYEPWFHEVLHPDGTPYDHRDLDWVRNFKFAEDGEISDPGAEITERWTKWRAWKWMATGPVKGIYYKPEGIGKSAITRWVSQIIEAESVGYNGIRIKLDFTEWKSNPVEFYKKVDTLLYFTNASKMMVMPVLLEDGDALNNDDDSLSDFVSSVIKKYGFDSRIHSWELYSHPGEKVVDRERIASLIGLIFRVARFEFPNQPLTATPLVRTKTFPPDFDAKKALVHGVRNGWSRLEYSGTSDPELCNYIWSLSDILSFSSSMPVAETGWLLSVANRYGRPVVCTNWATPDLTAYKETLEIFSKSKVFWYNGGKIIDPASIKAFRFSQISTPLISDPLVYD